MGIEQQLINLLNDSAFRLLNEYIGSRYSLDDAELHLIQSPSSSAKYNFDPRRVSRTYWQDSSTPYLDIFRRFVAPVTKNIKERKGSSVHIGPKISLLLLCDFIRRYEPEFFNPVSVEHGESANIQEILSQIRDEPQIQSWLAAQRRYFSCLKELRELEALQLSGKEFEDQRKKLRREFAKIKKELPKFARIDISEQCTFLLSNIEAFDKVIQIHKIITDESNVEKRCYFKIPTRRKF